MTRRLVIAAVLSQLCRSVVGRAAEGSRRLRSEFSSEINPEASTESIFDVVADEISSSKTGSEVVYEGSTAAGRAQWISSHGIGDGGGAALTTASDEVACHRYMEEKSCAWTKDYSCPEMAYPGLRGRSVEDGTISFKCCCTLGGWTGYIRTRTSTSTIAQALVYAVSELPVATAANLSARATASPTTLTHTVTRTINYCRAGNFDLGTSYPGNALRLLTSVSNAGDCCDACQSEPQCFAWTWGDRRAGERAATCALKGNAPRQTLAKVQDAHFISGVEETRIMHLYTPPQRQSLYCFSLLRVDNASYEIGLLQAQYAMGASIFNCDEYDLYSNESVQVARGVNTTVVDVDLTCHMGGEFMTALNTQIFLKVWRRLVSHGRFAAHDWTVKVDPDAVFFPSRMRHVVQKYAEDDAGVYLNNCKFGMHGPIEVFSGNAVKLFVDSIDKCWSFFWQLCSGDCMWGEDMFMDQCLIRVVKSKRIDESKSLLVEDHCNAPKGWRNCRNGQVASLHPFKDKDDYTECYANSREVEMYEWSALPHMDLANRGDVEYTDVHNDSDIEKVKRMCEEKGYVGFSLVGGKAYMKSTEQPLSEDELSPANSTTFYLFGPPKGGPVASSTTTTTVRSTSTETTSTTTETRTRTTTTATTATTTTTQTIVALHPCLVEAEPVYSFWNSQNREHTFHMDGPWSGERQAGSEPIFYAFRRPVEGTEAVYDFWARGLLDHTFHMGGELVGEQRNDVQFYAFKERAEGAEPIYAFWRESDTEHTYHRGKALDGERKMALAFHAFDGPRRGNASHLQDCAFLRPCFERDVVFTPSESVGPGTTERGVLDCQARCRSTPRCAHFSYLHYDRSCHLTTAEARREHHDRDSPSSAARFLLAFRRIVSGPPECAPVVSAGWNDTYSRAGTSWVPWRVVDDDDPVLGLLSGSYNASEVARREATVLQYEGPDECYNWSVTYQPFGLPGRKHTHEISMSDCLQRCRSAPDCAHFTFLLYDGTCHLAGDSAQAVSSRTLGAASGSRHCGRSRMAVAVALEEAAGQAAGQALRLSVAVGDCRMPVVSLALSGAALLGLTVLAWRYRKFDGPVPRCAALTATETQGFLETRNKSLGPEYELVAVEMERATSSQLESSIISGDSREHSSLMDEEMREQEQLMRRVRY